MGTKKRTTVYIVLVSVLMLAVSVQAASINATSCSQTAVQNALNAAATGDTVNVPAGNCTWSVGVLVPDRKIILKGAGSDLTIISANVDNALSAGGIQPFDISGMQFTGGMGNTIIRVSGSSTNWRIHHLKFQTNGAPTRIFMISGKTYGLIDHNIVNGGTPSEFVTVDDNGWDSWMRPLTFGDANAVFIEDNTVAWTGSWEGRPALDGENGGRAVFRHNDITNSNITVHGFDSGYGPSMLSTEVYENIFRFSFPTLPANQRTWARLGFIRGGTGVFFNNKYILDADIWLNSKDIKLTVYRNDSSFPSSAWPVCDGTQYMMCGVTKSWGATSSNPSACASGGFKFCSQSKTTLCSADSDCPGGETCNAYMDMPRVVASTSTNVCFMQPGFGPQMKSMPWYGWNNTLTGAQFGSATVGIAAESGPIYSGVDFFSNTVKPGYTPYVYPHPLQGGTPPPPPTPSKPKNFKVLSVKKVISP